MTSFIADTQRVDFKRGPSYPECTLQLLQPEAASAGAIRIIEVPYDDQDLLILSWNGMPVADLVSLESFYLTISSGEFTYTDTLGNSIRCHFAGDISTQELAFDYFAVKVPLQSLATSAPLIGDVLTADCDPITADGDTITTNG